ncbi:uncharacterized protein [Procambarus clarkii]|uniref:uncharacterized protein n=1 Tax=Procambarus clarkii TaxID=6728 RepID=UPI001E673C8A|nr:uncharacterized protein LOC123760614 [Procambarus clarkii]
MRQHSFRKSSPASSERLPLENRVRENSAVLEFGPMSGPSKFDFGWAHKNHSQEDNRTMTSFIQKVLDAEVIRDMKSPGEKSYGNFQDIARRYRIDHPNASEPSYIVVGEEVDKTRPGNDSHVSKFEKLVSQHFPHAPDAPVGSGGRRQTEGDVGREAPTLRHATAVQDYSAGPSYIMMKASAPQKSRGMFDEELVEAEADGYGGDGGTDGGGISSLKTGGGPPEPVEVTSVSYLSVPDDVSEDRRPSTADIVIEKLRVEKVEGGGLSIQGVVLASHCHVTLCVFGVFFMVAGVILSYVSYSVNMEAGDKAGEDQEEKMQEDEAGASQEEAPGDQQEGGKTGETHEVSRVVQMRTIGPVFLAVGVLMLFLGLILFALARKIGHDEKAKQRALADQQLCQLENSFSYANSSSSPLHTAAPAPHQQYPILSVRRNSWWVDPGMKKAGGVFSNIGTHKDTVLHGPSPLRESESPPPLIMTPLPLELLPDASDTYNYKDIACFPRPTNMGPLPVTEQQVLPLEEGGADLTTTVASQPEGGDDLTTATDHPSLSSIPAASCTDWRSTTPLLSCAEQELRTAVLVPSSATLPRTHGTSTMHTSSKLPVIQVTEPQPQTPPVPVVLPRLSRHCSTRPDSRPTTADFPSRSESR